MGRVILYTAIALLLVMVGRMIGLDESRDVLEHQRGQYATKLAEAELARDAANAHADRTTRNWSAHVDAIIALHEKESKHDKELAARVITDLRNDVVRLRVRTNPAPAAGRGQLPGPASSACECDGTTEQTLAGAVAARLAGRYADYNAAVEQLTACQGILAAERTQ